MTEFATDEEIQKAADEFVDKIGRKNAELLLTNLEYTRTACDAIRFLKVSLLKKAGYNRIRYYGRNKADKRISDHRTDS